MYDTTWHIIGRGFADWHAQGICKWGSASSSGGTLDKYAAEAADGAVAYDAHGADKAAFIAWTFAGPMADPTLPPDGARKCGADQRQVLAGMAPGLSGGFAALAAAAQSDTFSGLDSVGVELWAALFRARVPGVRFGRVAAGAVAWED